MAFSFYRALCANIFLVLATSPYVVAMDDADSEDTAEVERVRQMKESYEKYKILKAVLADGNLDVFKQQGSVLAEFEHNEIRGLAQYAESRQKIFSIVDRLAAANVRWSEFSAFVQEVTDVGNQRYDQREKDGLHLPGGHYRASDYSNDYLIEELKKMADVTAPEVSEYKRNTALSLIKELGGPFYLNMSGTIATYSMDRIEPAMVKAEMRAREILAAGEYEQISDLLGSRVQEVIAYERANLAEMEKIIADEDKKFLVEHGYDEKRDLCWFRSTRKK